MVNTFVSLADQQQYTNTAVCRPVYYQSKTTPRATSNTNYFV